MTRLVPPFRPAALAGCVAAFSLLAAPVALAEEKVTTAFPASLERQELLAWLKRETDIAPRSVVAISPLALIAIMQTQATPSPQGFEVTVRAEILDPAFAAREHLLSWHATIKLACHDRTVSVGEATGHAQRNLLGEGHAVEVTGQGWKPVAEGTMQGQIWSARCDKDFKPPLAEEDARPGPPPPVAARATAPAVTAPMPPPKASSTTPAPPVPARAASAAMAPAKPAVKSTVKSSVQILASPTAAEAERALATLKARLPDALAGLKTEVVTVQAGSVTHHRAIVSGFTAAGDASRFCQTLKAAGRTCFVRGDMGRAPGEPPPAR